MLINTLSLFQCLKSQFTPSIILKSFAICFPATVIHFQNNIIEENKIGNNSNFVNVLVKSPEQAFSVIEVGKMMSENFAQLKNQNDFLFRSKFTHP